MKRIHIILYALLCSLSLMAQGEVHEMSASYVWPADTLVRQRLQAWQDLKFGILLHWGLYSVAGIVESWSICDEGWIRRDTTRTYQQYKDWYWGLADEFKPEGFNPKQWADVSQRAGMKYMVFTTKHHDGFCLWDSRETDFTIARHAFAGDARRDALRHVLDAYRAAGFMVGTYFSKPDWHSPYYWWDVYATKGRNVNYNVAQHPWRWAQFKRFTHAQVKEILTRYGHVDILWLDGGWVCKENGQDIDMPALAAMARRAQPGLLIVDRTVRGAYENYLTPERGVPAEAVGCPWESCIPLSDDWGWVGQPRWKSADQVIATLIEVVAKGGNLLLGVGPTPDGTIEPAAVRRLEAIGQWLKMNGEAIYATRPLPCYRSGDVWFTQAKDGLRRYALYVPPHTQAELPATISWKGNLPTPKTTMRLLPTGEELSWRTEGDSVCVQLPKHLPREAIAISF